MGDGSGNRVDPHAEHIVGRLVLQIHLVNIMLGATALGVTQVLRVSRAADHPVDANTQLRLRARDPVVEVLVLELVRGAVGGQVHDLER